MQVTVVVPDKVKRAVRYLEITPEIFQDMLEDACDKRMEILVGNAKARHAKTQTMEEISPEPV